MKGLCAGPLNNAPFALRGVGSALRTRNLISGIEPISPKAEMRHQNIAHASVFIIII